MKRLTLYPEFEETFFVERDNRFVMTLKKKDGQLIKAYIANPGRMEEFLVKEHPFFVTSGNSGKYNYHAISTLYEGSYILLNTIKINFLVETMLRQKLIPEFSEIETIRREKTVHHSKFDFLLERTGTPPTLLEIKSCSLCHKGTAMFPDAPTKRGKRHLEDLNYLAEQNYDCYNLYLTTHSNADVFMPNGHTDPDYC
ncbi:MAG: DNA/RNA nuclease SfsA, partial [bacterium]|nr:DNA/RNA nuclease SfsA [bacterium]